MVAEVVSEPDGETEPYGDEDEEFEDDEKEFEEDYEDFMNDKFNEDEDFEEGADL